MNESSLEVLITRLPESEGLELPSYQTDGSAGMDVRAAEDRVLQPGETALIPTGFSIAVPVGYEAQMRPRSGLALKHGITLMNSPGTIDSDYRGPVGVILSNLGHEPFFIHRGDRIAQMIIAQVERACWKEVGTLDDTARGAGGFGSSGRS
jgi:dUTP pyrophosphatase